MAKGRDKQGRETKKKKKAKQPATEVPQNVQFRHHSVVTDQPETPPRSTE
ncbi:MAG TPA: hypothetical protein VN906_05290 [Candidatus Sulfotelmatobacter sp.]|jgi:hypothetical protein|nr:hypothetical protein [Candidatus Sulfotelmatobacter sp.]